jgi:flagellar biosynthetic protein FliR
MPPSAPPATIPPDWPHFSAALVLVMVRLSGLMVFAPIFSSEAIPARVKAIFVLTSSFLLAPVVAALPLAHAELDILSVAGELSIGLVFGIQLSLLLEIALFAGQVLGFQFSFSLVNLLDPYAQIQTPLMSQMLSLLATLVLFASGLYREILLGLLRTFIDAPVGTVLLNGRAGLAAVTAFSGVFFAALQLAAPVVAATMLVEVTVAMLGKLSPQLPVMMVAIPAKTLLGYIVLIGSLALWPRFLERHFAALLDGAQSLIRHSMGVA